MNLTTKYLAAAALLCAIATGCNMNKKSSSSSSVPPMNVAAVDVPAPTPAATFTPQQPVTYDAPQTAVAEEEPASDAFASTEEIAPPRSTPAPKARTRSAASIGTKYKIKKGDSLWSIAQAKYGSGAKWKTIAAANPKMDPNKIQAGQTIILP